MTCYLERVNATVENYDWTKLCPEYHNNHKANQPRRLTRLNSVNRLAHFTYLHFLQALGQSTGADYHKAVPTFRHSACPVQEQR